MLTRALQEDESINFDALINEQMDCFYHLQPAQTTLDDNFYVLDKNQQPFVIGAGKKGERKQSMLDPTGEGNHKEMSFGNQAAFKGYLGAASSDLDTVMEEGPRSENQIPSPEKPTAPTLNPFRVRDTPDTGIVPGHMPVDKKLTIKAPSILQSSDIRDRNHRDLLQSQTDSDAVFYTDRDCTTDRKRVDFDLNSSPGQASMLQS